MSEFEELISGNKEINECLKKIEKMFSGRNSKKVSDVISIVKGKECQYVDLVMEGGGVLGIALIGYIYALEKAGIRFLSIGGTSVGAVVSLLLASAGYRDEEKGRKLAEILFNLDFKNFIDGRGLDKYLSLQLGRNSNFLRPGILFPALGRSFKLWKCRGLNTGKGFQDVMTTYLRGFGVSNEKDLQKKITMLPKDIAIRGTGRKVKEIRETKGFKTELAIIAADITTESKVVFPEMAGLYWDEPEKINPVNYIRASMSIPLFFEPFCVSGINSINGFKKRWKKIINFDGEVPDRAFFTDGGVFSNFPIDVFHEEGVPLAPTFGIKLGSKGRQVNAFSNLFEYTGTLFSSMMHYADFDFISKHKEYNSLISFIDTSEHNWLNFFMDSDEKISLFTKGVVAAYQFLKDFEWDEYKELRAGGSRLRIIKNIK